MSGVMYRALKILVVGIGVCAMWAAPGSAFQLFGGGTDMNSGGIDSLQQAVEEKPKLDGAPLNLGTDGKSDPSSEEGMDIWIPYWGVVGKMPKLDFGMEMLYGAEEDAENDPARGLGLKEFGSDFSIKGTIKRKF